MRRKHNLLIFLTVLLFYNYSYSLTFDTNQHLSVSYDPCSIDNIKIEFVYYDAGGDDDEMDWFKVEFKNASGNWQLLWRWEDDDDDDGVNSSWSSETTQGESFYYRTFYGSVGRDWNRVGDVYTNILTWYNTPLNLIQDGGTVEFRFNGYYNGDGINDTETPITNVTKSISMDIPPTPTALTATDDNCNGINLSWTNSNNVPTCLQSQTKTFILQDGNSTPIGSVPYSDTDYFISNVNPGSEHNFSIYYEYHQSSSVYIRGGGSGNAEGERKSVPDVPANLLATDDNCESEIYLTWEWNALSPENFRIRRNNQILTTVAGNLRSYTDEGVNRGVNYNYVIEAKNDCGWSAWSPSISGISPVDPDKPADVNSMVIDGVGVEISWPSTSNTTAYQIERSQLGGGGSSFFDIDNSNLFYLDSSLVQCQTYEYRLRSFNDCKPDGVLSDSIVVTKLTPDLSTTFLSNNLLSSKGFFPNRVELNWTVDNNQNFLNGFQVFRKVLGSDQDSTVIASLNSGSNIYVDNLVDAGVLYEYTIVGETQCEETTIYSNVASSVGFRSPFGTITGQVAYEGGVAVKDVRITAESTAQIFGKSLAFDGNASLNINQSNSLNVDENVLVESWINPAELSTDFSLIKKQNVYDLKYNSSANQFEFVVSQNGSESTPVTMDASNFLLNNYNHIAAQLYQDSLKIYANGIKMNAIFVGANTIIDDANSSIQIGNGFTGLIDEVRIWNVGKTDENIEKDFSRLMGGGETGLKVYLRMNEGVGKYAYDISKSGNLYNRNHAAFVGDIAWSQTIPDQNQLGIAAYTDDVGNYVMTVPYNGIGETFILTPSFQIHVFEPSTQAIYVGDGSFIHNNINFADKSSFRVTGTVFYDNTTCPAKDIFLKVDGQIIPVNGQPPVTDAGGNFDIQVPIGEHFITVEKAGHVFSVGRFPETGTFDFQADKAGVNFKDSTLVKVVGRVVGGLREAEKIPGLGKSKNNIGIAQVVFKSQSGNGCKTDTIFTDSLTGEYHTMLPPLKYVPNVNIVNNPAINFGVLDLIDLGGTPILQTKYDSIYDENEVLVDVDSVSFHKQIDYIHRVDPTIIVVDKFGEDAFIGETEYQYINTVTQDTATVDLRANPFRWPIFMQKDDDFFYRCLIKVFEPYENYDLSSTTPIRDSVPTTDGKLKFKNELADIQDVELELNKVNSIDTLKYLIYTFKPGMPNFVENTSIPDYSFTRKLEINLITSTGQAIPWLPVAPGDVPTGGDQIFRGYLLGGQSNGEQFVTTGPQVPEYILRDPPGSGSSSTREVGSTKSETNTWSWNLGAAAHTQDDIYLGAKFNIGLGVSTATEIENNNTAGFKAEIGGGNQGTQSIKTTNTQAWSTNSGEDQVGAGSDLYVGKAKNIQFGIAEHLALVPDSLCAQVECIGTSNNGYTFAKNYGLSVVPGGYETTFIYNESHIKTYLMPDLLALRNAMLQSNPKYTSALPIDDPNYGKNNDDPVFGNAVSSTNPNSGEYADLTGPSYTYNATSLTDTLSGDSVRFINNQLMKWKEAIALNEWEKVNIDNTVVIDSLKEKELDDLYDEYELTIAGYATLIVATGLSGVVVAYGLISSPVPGTAIAGYTTFAVSTASSIGLAEISQSYNEYLFKKQRIEEKFNQSPVNYSISGTNSFTSSITHESASSYTRSMEYEMSAEFKVAVSGKVNNNGVGIEKGLEMKFKSGRDWASDTSSLETVSFTLQDPDQGDYFSVDVYPSILGWGPVFKKQPGGATSCPHEDAIVTEFYEPGTIISGPTLARDKPTISASPSILTNVPVDEAAVFNLTLGNESEAGDPRIYNVSLVSNSNPFGALVSIDGAPPSLSVAVPFGTAINKVVSVYKGPGPVYNYDSLKFIITSPCQFQAGTSDNVDIVEEAYVSAHFIPSCSEVGLATPEDQWVLNNSFQDTMPVAIIDYNINFFDLEKIRFDYKPSSEPDWIGLKTFYKDTTGLNDPSLSPIPTGTPFTLYDWDVAQIVDGEYDVRVTTLCALAEKSSVTHSGIMDRINPHPFGNPSPADGILGTNDEISIKFNEPIDLGSLTSLNFDVRGVLNGTEHNHSTSLYFDGVDDYLEIVGGAPLQNRDFTIEFSARRNGTGEQAIFTQGSDIAESIFIGFNTNDQFVFRIGTTEIASTNTYTDTDWHYFAVSYDFEDETAFLYVADQSGNGIVNNGNTTIYPDYKGSGRVRIGKSTFNNSNFFNGNIHGLRIWSTSRSLAEFSASMSKYLSGNEPGLLFNWRMDEAEGIIAEDHVRRRDASIFGPIWQIDPGGSAVEFNGIDQYLKMSTGTVNITDGMDFTLEFWFNSTQSGAATLFSNGTGDGTQADSLYSWNIDKDTDGKIHVRNYGIDFIAVDNNYFDGNWHHFALVLRRAGNISAYIDGNLENSTQAINFQQLGGASMFLGARGYATGTVETVENHFEGKMDEFRFWNASRKLEQIRRDKQNRMKGDEYALQLYLPFENYELDPTDVPILTPTFTEQILDGTVEENGSTLVNQTPTIKLQRPIEAVAFTYSVNNDEIILTTTTARELIENVTLDITVKNVRDRHGNVMESPKTWIAYIDKNQVIWQDDLLEFEKLAGDELSFSSAILNQGGAAKMFEIINIPEWLTVSPTEGTIAPNSVMTIDFEIDQFVNIGRYFENVQLLTDFNYPENLGINLTVKAEKPDWEIDPADYENSMGIIGMLKIRDVFSSDKEDLLAAFVGDEVRGIQQLEYVEQADAYRVFLDVYSNENYGEDVTFKIWDASAGIIYSKIDPLVVPFEANTLVGTISNPQVFATDTEIKYDIPISEGWNWVNQFLYNVDSTNLDVTLESIEARTGDLIKSLYNHSDFAVGSGWKGLLNEEGIVPENLYKLKVAEDGIFTIKGEVIDPTTRPISLVNNWNWIGFISIRNQSITQALGNLNAADGDIIKGQSQFAVYDPLLGWIGSLSTLIPGEGYMYKSIGDKSFVYPLAGFYRGGPDPQDDFDPKHWAVDYGQSASNMTMILELNAPCATYLSNGNYAVGSFNGKGEITGVAPILDQEDRAINYLTAMGNFEDQLRLSLLDLQELEAYDLDASIPYESNAHIGNRTEPMLVKVSDEICGNLTRPEITDSSISAFPSVFSNEITVEYLADFEDEDAQIVLYNTWGQIVYEQPVIVDHDYNKYSLQLGKLNLASGVYYLLLKSEYNTESIKLIKEN